MWAEANTTKKARLRCRSRAVRCPRREPLGARCAWPHQLRRVPGRFIDSDCPQSSMVSSGCRISRVVTSNESSKGAPCWPTPARNLRTDLLACTLSVREHNRRFRSTAEPRMLAEGRIDCVLYPMGDGCARLDVSPYFMVGEPSSNHGFFRLLRKCLKSRPEPDSRQNSPRITRIDANKGASESLESNEWQHFCRVQ